MYLFRHICKGIITNDLRKPYLFTGPASPQPKRHPLPGLRPNSNRLGYIPSMITKPTTVTLTKRAPDILIDKEKVIMGILAEANLRHSKALCPVLTGNLRDSIEVIKYGDHVLVGSELPYAGVVEYGTLTRTPVAYLRRGLQLAINEVRKKLRKT